ncbi:hypothetical protein EFM18_07275, partial [Limosilactobacillus fermentum]|nr:hypothetical protein [Limosilactobacillus fermentum]
FFLMDCVVTPLKTLMGFSVHLNVQLKFYNLPVNNICNPVFDFCNCHFYTSFNIIPKSIISKKHLATAGCFLYLWQKFWQTIMLF